MSDWEGEIGIFSYYSEDVQCRGEIKRYPEDFIVEEEGALGKAKIKILKGEKAPLKPAGSGEYLYVVMEKKDWDTNDIIKRVARTLGISRNRISFAGYKDKYALTAQWVSLWRVTWKELTSVNIKDVAFHTPVYQSKKLRKGQLKGNWFTIKVRGCELPEELPSAFPNFFGHQRFGSYRFVSHLVGREILKEEYENAVYLYITRSSPYEPEQTRKARETAKHIWGDFKEMLSVLPKSLRKERTIIGELLKGKSYRSALFSLGKPMISLFINAYQSYVFNYALSRCIEEECKERKGKVPGYILWPDKHNLFDSFLKEVLENDGIEKEDFRKFKRFSTQGDWRNTIEEAQYLTVSGNTLSFFLNKSAYATSFLREVLKPKSPIGFLISKEKVKS